MAAAKAQGARAGMQLAIKREGSLWFKAGEKAKEAQSNAKSRE